MNVLLEPCYILHVQDYKESSLLLRVLSMCHGRVDLLAKGAKRKNNRHRHLYQTWQALRISWRQRGALGVLTAIEAESVPSVRPEGFPYCGFYLNEIVLRLVHCDEPHPELFTVYHDTLNALQTGSDFDIPLRYFEKRLLDVLGYGLILDRNVDDQAPISPSLQYFYAYENGPQKQRTRHTSGQPVSGETLLALGAETLSAMHVFGRDEAKQLLRGALHRQLGGQALQSRVLYRAWLSARNKREKHYTTASMKTG